MAACRYGHVSREEQRGLSRRVLCLRGHLQQAHELRSGRRMQDNHQIDGGASSVADGNCKRRATEGSCWWHEGAWRLPEMKQVEATMGRQLAGAEQATKLRFTTSSPESARRAFNSSLAAWRLRRAAEAALEICGRRGSFCSSPAGRYWLGHGILAALFGSTVTQPPETRWRRTLRPGGNHLCPHGVHAARPPIQGHVSAGFPSRHLQCAQSMAKEPWLPSELSLFVVV